MSRSAGASLICALALALGGCDDATGVGATATVNVLLTDAPAGYLDRAMVDIGAVELLGGAGGPIVLSEDGTSGPVNLLDLRDAATMALASTEIGAGAYTQLRLVIETASVTLSSDHEFAGGGGSDADLVVPSGAQTGIKLNLAAGDADGTKGAVEIVPGEMVLVVDFDVNQSFVIQGHPDTPAGITGVTFKPTLRVVVDDVAGSLSGVVSTDLPGVSLGGLVVSAEPVGQAILEPFQTAAATATTAADGSYEIFFLVPGDYEVSVAAGDGLTAGTVTVTVGEGGDVADVNLKIVQG